MIGFFRRIRKKLADDNQFLKYSRYAIGEIVLVVVGILIALSINNWNEGKKGTAQQVKILQEIQDELKGTIKDLNSDIESHKRNRNSSIIIRDIILFNKEYNDTLNRHFLYLIDEEELRAKQSAFESLQSIGLEIISNDSVRRKITTAYLYIRKLTSEESHANKLASTLMKILEPHIVVDREALISYPKTDIEFWHRNLPFKMSNYNELLNNEAFLYNVMTIIDSRFFNINGSETFKNSIEEVISDIDEELKRLE